LNGGKTTTSFEIGQRCLYIFNSKGTQYKNEYLNLTVLAISGFLRNIIEKLNNERIQKKTIFHRFYYFRCLKS